MQQLAKSGSTLRLQSRRVGAAHEHLLAPSRPLPAPRPLCPPCPAASDEKGGVVKGPISVGSAAGVVGDVVSAVADKAKMMDRSKGLWTRCDNCGAILYIKHLKEHHHICFGCNYHLKMSSAERIDHLLDPGTWRPMDETLSPVDPLEFSDMKAYTDRLKEAQAKTGMQDGIRTGTGMLHGIPVALGVMDFSFMGGSMGSVVGEKLTRLIEYATQEGLALLIVSTSGGARMQEGILSLMQMAKISAALHVHQNCAKLLFISILTSPTTGGVTASFGMLGDINLAEPQAIIGFAGRRVIEQTLQEQLPDDFQTAEYLLEKGLLDLVVPRSFLKGALYEMIDFYRAAPFKQRGVVPYGVQRGSYLAVEEKLRRKWQQWKEQGQQPKAALLAASEQLVQSPSEDLSYSDLVTSFKMLYEEDDTKDALNESNLKEAVSLARQGMVSWSLVEEAPQQSEFKYAVHYATEPVREPVKKTVAA